MKTKELTLAAALLTIAGSASNCSSSEQTATVSNDPNQDMSAETLAAQDQDSNIDDFIQRYKEGQGDPIESKVYEKIGENGQTERYALIDVPQSKPHVYANDQDVVKAATNIQVFQQLDGSKTDTLTEANQSNYHGTPTSVRYYPSYNSGAYNGGYSAFSQSYHGYYTDITEPVHNVSQRQIMHQNLTKSFSKNSRGMFSKVTAKSLKSITRFSSIREIGKFGGMSSRMGGTRGGFRGTSFHAGG